MMSATTKLENQEQLKSNPMQNVSGELKLPISVANVTNYGACNIGINNQGTTNNEPQLKVMFQVRNPISTFTGREAFLEDLHDSIQHCRKEESTVSVLSQTITGLGGIGKSETVRMYIKKFSYEYDNIVWIDAEKSSEAMVQFTSLAFHNLHINTRDQNGNLREFSHILADVYEKLCQKPKLLLIIFDNSEALDDIGTHATGIRQFLPQQTITIEPPIILITSRQQYWEDMNVVQLGLWKMEECLDFIYKRLRLKDTPENKKEATELAQLFDRLPNAIEVAASVIVEQSRKKRVCGSGDYGIKNLITDYAAGDRNILRKKTQHNASQATMQLLLTVTLDKIKANDDGELAIKILALMAYLSPTSIPKKMIHALLQETNEQERDSALILLADYSIIQSYKTYFSVHRVIQDIVITMVPNLKLRTIEAYGDSVEDTNEIRILSELTRSFAQFIPTIAPTNDDYNDVVANVVHITDYIIQNSMVSKFYTYIETIANFIQKTHFALAINFYRALIDFDGSTTQIPAGKISTNLNVIADIFFQNGRYEKALETYDELLKQYNGNDPHGSLNNDQQDTLRTQMNIANCLRVQGKAVESLELLYLVENDQKKVFGPLHPDTLRTKMNIGVGLSKLGKIEEALKLYFVVEKEQEKVHGPLHPDILRTKRSIGIGLSNQGKYEEVLKLYYEVEKEQEKVLGSLHPDIFRTKINIANSLSNLGKIEDALKIYNMVVEERINVLGPLHPDTLRTKMSIGIGLASLGKIEEALQFYHRLEKKQEQVLGPLNPYTIKTKVNIANCLTQQGRIKEALKIYNVVLEERSKVLGPLHPDTLRIKMSIGIALSNQGKIEEALKLYSLVAKEREQVLGPLHPDTLRTKMNIGNRLRDQGKIKDALQLYYTVDEEQQKALGPLHKSTLLTRTNIANSLSSLGRKEEAILLYKNVLNIQCEVFGPLHPCTLKTKSNQAVCISDISSREEAYKLLDAVHEEHEKVYGPSHPIPLLAKMNTANCLSELGKTEEAAQLYDLVENNLDKMLDPLHPHILLTKMNKAILLSNQSRMEEAMTLFRFVLEAQEKLHGPLFPHTIVTKMNMTVCLSDLGRKTDALKLYDEVQEQQEKVFGPEHPHILLTKANISNCEEGNKEEYLRLYYVD